MVTKDYSKSRMRENRTYGSVRGGQSNLIPSTRLTAFQAEGCSGALRAHYKMAPQALTLPPWSGLYNSPLNQPGRRSRFRAEPVGPRA